jgi:hypothetical protein
VFSPKLITVDLSIPAARWRRISFLFLLVMIALFAPRR